MDKSLVASQSIQIKSTPREIWDVMTNPEKIKIYLYGTQVQTDWQKGSPIVFQGDYQGTRYTDKGNVIENDPERLLIYNYWSGFSGMEDKPENYASVSYKIERTDDDHCEFTWHQQGFASEEGKCHTEEGLKAILGQIKTLAEEATNA